MGRNQFYYIPMPSNVKYDKVLFHVVVQVGYPLVTLLLCLGDPQIFHNNLSPHMEQLYKLLRVSLNSIHMEIICHKLLVCISVYLEFIITLLFLSVLFFNCMKILFLVGSCRIRITVSWLWIVFTEF